MIIKTHEKSIPQHICNALKKGIDVGLPLISQELICSIDPLINDFLSFSSACYPHYYSLHSSEIIGITFNPEHILRKNAEIKCVGRDKFIRNFKVLLYTEDSDEEIYFPLQEVKIKAKAGSVVIFPTSYMFPYTILEKSCKKIQLNYSFDTSAVLDPVKKALGFE